MERALKIAQDRHDPNAVAYSDYRELLERRDLEAVIATVADAAGGLPARTVHNDAKLANVVLDPDDRTPRAVLDLDTTMPDHSRRVLVDNLGVHQNDVYTLEAPLGLGGLMQLYDIDRYDLKEKSFTP